MTREADLYLPVKAMLEAKGYEVKAEVKGCDVVGVKADVPTVIVELKLAFSLDLVVQGVSRQALTDDVYLAVLAPDTPLKRKNWRARQKGYLKLCHKLGLGLMHVTAPIENNGQVRVLLDPKTYTPRKNGRKKTQLIAEFKDRAGDPNIGGVNRTKIMTAYRQDALRCALVLEKKNEMKVSDIRAEAGVQNAASILQKNHYNWFERAARGIYCLSKEGRKSLHNNPDAISMLKASNRD